MSENELVKMDDLGTMPIDKHSDDDWDAAASSTTFLPRLQLMTSNSEKCKTGEFPTNHYAMIQDQKFDDLGPNIDILLVTWRPKALEVGDDGVISVFDPNNAEFQRIQDRSMNETNSGCMFGPEFLCWIPSVSRFATFFMGTKSSRREAGNVKARLKKAATLGSTKIETKKFTWFAPQVSDCSTPFDMPGKDDMLAAVEQFNNPPVSDMEGVSDSKEARAR